MKLQLQMVVSCHVSAIQSRRSPLEEQPVHLTTGPPFRPFKHIFNQLHTSKEIVTAIGEEEKNLYLLNLLS